MVVADADVETRGARRAGRGHRGHRRRPAGQGAGHQSRVLQGHRARRGDHRRQQHLLPGCHRGAGPALQRPRRGRRGRREGRSRRGRRGPLLALRVLAQAARVAAGHHHRPRGRARRHPHRRAGGPSPPTSPSTTCGSPSTSPARGYAIAYEPGAKAFEPPVHTSRQQWERRTRSVAGALHVFQRRRGPQLRPDRRVGGRRDLGTPAGALHRVAAGAPGAVAVMALRRARSSRLAKLFLLGHVIGAWAVARRMPAGPPTAPPPHACDAARHRCDRGSAGRVVGCGAGADAAPQALGAGRVPPGRGPGRHRAGTCAATGATRWTTVRR